MDIVITVALAGSVGLFALAHFALFLRLSAIIPVWRALVALLLVPLLPYWGYKAGLRTLPLLWGATLVMYGFAFTLAR